MRWRKCWPRAVCRRCGTDRWRSRCARCARRRCCTRSGHRRGRDGAGARDVAGGDDRGEPAAEIGEELQRLAAAGVTEDDLKGIDAEVKRIVADAAEFARTSPEPDPSELYTDVYLEAAQ